VSGHGATHSGGLILLYHRVVDLPTDPQRLAVRPMHFEAQLAVLLRTGVVLPLVELVERAAEGTLPAGAVAITFDDGYADNVHVAKPMLARWDAPAMVFVTTRDGSEPFWWDRLAAMLLMPGRLPRRIELALGQERVAFDLGDDAALSAAAFSQRRGWHVECDGVRTPRQAMYEDLCRRLRPMDAERRAAVLHQLAEAVQYRPVDVATCATMDDAQLRALVAGGVIEVGAHTVSHPVLAMLSAEEQRREIAESKRRLEAIVGRAVAAFSYPYGTRRDFDADSVRLVREAGFACACANVPGRVDRQVDVFRLPRCLVRDWDGATFARQLEQWRAA